ncbi:hypothetical protein D9V29_11750 [Mycetocola manganoxydans]|uniref:Bacterial Ig-like domain-containing protein n=2 Tax=Mycetocola manganoxydans TaxID=699879 RepID=A0A3L6ZNM4_9MICO|nr:hypothetical protein D9V29_11750 [Mycetocola manganoxydans]
MGGRSALLTRRRSRALAALAAASVAVLLSLALPTAADAEPETPPPSLVAPGPTITSPASGEFLGSASAVITGTKSAGSEVQVLAGASRVNVCTVRGERTTFSCSVSRLPSGPGIPLVAVQLLDGEDDLQSEPVILDILAPPAISGSDGMLTNGFMQGRGYPNATITLTVGGSSWTFPAGPDGNWAYVIPRSIGSGTHTVSATQFTTFSAPNSSDPSAPLPIRLDAEPPKAPTMTTPRGGSTIPATGAVYSGTGENGSTVEVFAVTSAGRDLQLCSTAVSGGAWSCSGSTLPPGSARITAFQTDAAGNVGPGSAPRALTVTAPPTTSPDPAPSTDAGDGATATPAAPANPPAASPEPSETTPAVPDATTPPPAAGPWEAVTPFTTGVPSALGAGELSWLRALVLAVLAVLLLLVPARMLATTVGARRVAASPLSVTGRNRVATHDDPAPMASAPGAVTTAILLVVIAGGIILFANPVHGQPEYLRVFLASVIAAALLNITGTLIPRAVASRLGIGSAEIRLFPRFLLSIAAVALLSRVLDLQPALLFGVVFTVSALAGTRAARGALAGIRIATLFVFGSVGWLASTLLGAPSGFVDTLLTEVANIAAVAGIGSAAILLIPLGKLDGRALLVWSRPIWFATAFVVLTVLFALLAPVVDVWQTNGAVLIGFLIVLAFGALGLSLWIWRRVVQPYLNAD